MVFCWSPSGWGRRIEIRQNKQRLLVDERFEKLSDARRRKQALGYTAALQRKPRPVEPAEPSPAGWAEQWLRTTRFQGPIGDGGAQGSLNRNTCHFSLGQRKLFILFSPDCFIWQFLGEMASSFPRALEAACLFLQLAVLQVEVMGTHTEARCHWWARDSTEIQGSGRASRAAEGPNTFPTFITDGYCLQLCQQPSEVLHPPSLCVDSLCAHWICS